MLLLKGVKKSYKEKLHCSDIFIDNLEQISHSFLVFLLLALNK